jgi:hypothetical protein
MATEKEKHGAGQGGQAADAIAMLEVFASVGVEFFDITHTSIDEEKRGFRPKQSLGQARASMPFLVPSSARRRNNVIIRPHQPPAVLLIQLDDLEREALERLRPVAFMIVATSPGNFQAWVAVAGELADRKDFARRVRKAAGADPSASGATRIAATGNYKRKFEPDFPTVRIEAAQAGRTVAPDELEALGLVAPAEAAPRTPPAAFKSQRAGGRAGKWPSYQHTLAHAPKAHGADRPDISRADFTWCMTAIDWGWSVEAVAARLMLESPKAQENGEGYAQLTARNAAAAVRRRAQPEYGP